MRSAFALVIDGSRWSRQAVVEFITNAPDGQDIFWPFGMLLDLGSETIDVGIDVPFVALVRCVPDSIEQVLPRIHMPWR